MLFSFSLFPVLSSADLVRTNSFLVTPVELIRNRMMLQYHRVGLGGGASGGRVASVSYKSSWDGIRQVFASTGFFGFFRGLSMTLRRDVVGVGW